jgi:hypothetical protein
MKIIHKDNLPSLSFPLPIFTSIHLADAISKEGEEFDVFVGLEEKYVEQLTQLSLDENDMELQTNTEDLKRFGVGSYENWYAKNRTPFCLIHKRTDTLVALVWFGPMPLSGNNANWHTIGWRSYNPFRGKDLMTNFTEFSINIYLKNNPNIRLWARVGNSNTRIMKIVTSLGFVPHDEISEENSVIMIR